MISAIILAAGQSRRMGTQKLALPIGDKPLLKHIFDQASKSKVDQIVVVVSSATEQLAGQILPQSAAIALNPNPESEMLDSVRCGIRALRQGSEAALIAIGDQPGINAQLIDAIIATYKKSRSGIVVPSHAGRRGHPILIASEYFSEVLIKYDDVGLRGLLEAHPGTIETIEIADANALEDIDEPGDYQRVVAGFGRGPDK